MKDKTAKMPRTILQALADPEPNAMNRTYARAVP